MTSTPWRQCADCAHQLPQPDTSAAGMHGCAALGGYRFAFARRVCAAWAPVGGPECAEADSQPPDPSDS